MITIRSHAHKILWIAAVALMPIIAQENSPIPSEAPLPTINEMIARLENNQSKLQDLIEKYTYREETILRMRKSDGSIQKEERTENEVTWINGFIIKRRLAKDGKPLAGEEADKEERRVQKRMAQCVAPRERKDKDEGFSLLGILRAVTPTFLKPGWYQGEQVYILEFVPNLKFKPKNTLQEQASKLAGKMIIDKKAYQILRLEAELKYPIRVAGGMAASFAPGSTCIFEQTSVNDEVWLPTFAQTHFVGRIFLVKELNIETETRFVGYQKFVVDSELQVSTPK